MAQQQITKDPPPRFPFRVAARQHVGKIDGVVYKAGTKAPQIKIPTVGWVSRIFVSMRGMLHAATVDPAFIDTVEMGWNLISRFRLNGNGGLANIVDVSGWDLYLHNHFIERSFKMDGNGAGSSDVDPTLVQTVSNTTLPAATTSQPLRITWVIPVAANHGNNFETGLINLQADDATFTLDLDFAALTDIFVTGAHPFEDSIPTIDADIEIYYEYYEMPDPTRVDLPLPLVVRLWSDEVAAKNGENRVPVLRGGTLMQAILVTKINGNHFNGFIDELQLKLNRNSTVYEMAEWTNRLVNRIQLGVDLPSGVNAFDFYHATQSVSEGDSRDMWDTEQYSNFDFIVKIAAGSVITPATSNIRAIYRTLHNLEG